MSDWGVCFFLRFWRGVYWWVLGLSAIIQKTNASRILRSSCDKPICIPIPRCILSTVDPQHRKRHKAFWWLACQERVHWEGWKVWSWVSGEVVSPDLRSGPPSDDKSTMQKHVSDNQLSAKIKAKKASQSHLTPVTSDPKVFLVNILKLKSVIIPSKVVAEHIHAARRLACSRCCQECSIRSLGHIFLGVCHAVNHAWRLKRGCHSCKRCKHGILKGEHRVDWAGLWASSLSWRQPVLFRPFVSMTFVCCSIWPKQTCFPTC